MPIKACDIKRHLPEWATVVKTVNQTPIYNMNIFENIMSWNQENLDAPAFHYYGTTITYRELPDRVNEYVCGFRSLGITEKDIVTLCLPVSIENMLTLFALNCMGTISNGVNYLFLKSDVSLYTKDKGSKTLMILDAYLPFIVDSLEDSGIKNVIITSLSDYLPENNKHIFDDPSTLPKRLREVFDNPEKQAACLQKIPTLTHIRFVRLADVIRLGKENSGSDKVVGNVMRYLTKEQAQLAYEAGAASSDTSAKALDAENEARANGKTGRKEGVVRGDGVTVKDLKDAFNDTQGMAYRYLTDVARATGIDIVLYRSEAGKDGKFLGAQGEYRRKEPGTIYIDLNAGLETVDDIKDLHKYAMLRTFTHEFVHFIEYHNPVQYNEFRKLVFDTQESRGVNVHARILAKQKKGLTYEAASREVVAEAMTDVLPDANFVQELAQKHKNVFQKLLDKLKEFAANLRDYFNSIGHNRSREANALKEHAGETVKYLDSIIQLFDKVAVQAVENYQQSVAAAEVTLDSERNDDVQYQNRNSFNPNPDALKVSPTEERETFERIRQDQMRRYMREHDGEIPGIWCSFGTSYFYVYSNSSFLKYRTYSKMLITGNEEIIDAISEGVTDG